MKKTFPWIIGTLALVIVVLLVVPGGKPGETNIPSGNSSTEQNPAPTFSLQDYSGNTVSLSDFHGTYLLVNSWATWCPFCVDEIPDFATIQKEFGEQVTVVLINRKESQRRAEEFLGNLELNERLIFLSDPRDSFYQSIGGIGMPETLFIDREGNIQSHKRGNMELQEMQERTQTLLASDTL